MRILKYPIINIGAPGMAGFDSPNVIDMPLGAKIIAAGFEPPRVCLWVEVDEGVTATQKRTFWQFGTGWKVDTTGRHLVHVGTVLEDEGRFVWHIYEERPVT